MNELLALLKSAAPALATVVAGPLGGMAVKAIAEKMGVEDTVEAVTQALQADPDAAAKLAEIDLAQFKAESADRDSARVREVGLAAAGGSRFAQLVMPILAVGTVALTYMFVGILLFKIVPTEQQQLIIFALGFMTASAQQVLSYYFGSSKSSQDKTIALAKGVK
jgi:membrane glycosyltransferase